MTINERINRSSWIVSLYTAFILYSKDELKKLPWIVQPLQLLYLPVAGLLRFSKIDKMIILNNNLLTTNLHPNFNADELRASIGFLLKEFPDHFFSFRSLTSLTDEPLIQKLINMGFIKFPLRQVYLMDYRIAKQSTKRDLLRDFKLLKKKDFTVVSGSEFNDNDWIQVQRLYRSVYIEKHSSYNPQYSTDFFNKCAETGFIKFIGLRDVHNELQGFVGLHHDGSVLTAPMLGYNTKLSPSLGLYRRLMALAIIEAEQEKKILNFSAGAAKFKRNRGAEPQIEYGFIYMRHLPMNRKIGLWILSGLLYSFAYPILKIFKI